MVPGLRPAGWLLGEPLVAGRQVQGQAWPLGLGMEPQPGQLLAEPEGLGQAPEEWWLQPRQVLAPVNARTQPPKSC